MKTSAILTVLLVATALAAVQGRSLLQAGCSLDALKAACPEYSTYFNADPSQLPDDCTIRALSVNFQAPSPGCCAAAQVFVNCGCTSWSIAVAKLALSPKGCGGFSTSCTTLGQCSAT